MKFNTAAKAPWAQGLVVFFLVPKELTYLKFNIVGLAASVVLQSSRFSRHLGMPLVESQMKEDN